MSIDVIVHTHVIQDAELNQLKATLHSLQYQAKQEFDERAVRRQHSFTASSLSGRYIAVELSTMRNI